MPVCGHDSVLVKRGTDPLLEETYCGHFIPLFKCWVSQTKGISAWQPRKQEMGSALAHELTRKHRHRHTNADPLTKPANSKQMGNILGKNLGAHTLAHYTEYLHKCMQTNAVDHIISTRGS